jgi:N-acetylneuraminate synthase
MTKIIAEIGINHNGSIHIAKDLIDLSKVAGCDYVKFQKRTPDICVPEAQKSKMRVTPWGEMAYIDYKKRIEFEEEQYDYLFDYCRKIGIGCFASVWDNPSVDFMSKYTDITKIPSALITNHELCSYAREKNDFLIVSTGMSTEEEIEKNVDICDPDVIMHTNSSYPSKVEELNLNYIKWLADKHPNAEIGYSGHEYGLVTTFAAVALGATWVERHITLDRNMWGSDHKSSIEPSGLIKLVKGIRDIEKSLGHFGPREVLGSELDKRKSLRGS